PRIILFYSLLCHCSHCLSVRHSFPTRRSSDLWRSEMRLPIKGKKVSKFKFARHLVILAGQGRGRRALARLATSAAESLRLLSSSANLHKCLLCSGLRGSLDRLRQFSTSGDRSRVAVEQSCASQRAGGQGSP